MNETSIGHHPSAADRTFVARFEACQVPLSEFDHRAHLRLAWAYLADADQASAVAAMRAALVRFLAHHGVDAGKYHETLTHAWLSAVHHFMAQSPGADGAEAFIDAHPTLLDPQLLLAHYSRQRLFSDAARAAFLPPDRAPFPEQDGGSPEP